MSATAITLPLMSVTVITGDPTMACREANPSGHDVPVAGAIPVTTAVATRAFLFPATR
jgi:hypothetical protein